MLSQTLGRLGRKYHVDLDLKEWDDSDRRALDKSGLAPLVGAESICGAGPVEGTGQLSTAVYLRVRRERAEHPLLGIDVARLAAPYQMRNPHGVLPTRPRAA
jgi:hypothetical protein